MTPFTLWLHIFSPIAAAVITWVAIKQLKDFLKHGKNERVFHID